MDWKTLVLALVGLLIVASQLILLMRDSSLFTHLAGLAVGVALEMGLAGIMRAAAPARPRRKKSEAGAQPCPGCGSLQTDLVVEEMPDGRKFSRRQCFNCDRTW